MGYASTDYYINQLGYAGKHVYDQRIVLPDTSAYYISKEKNGYSLFYAKNKKSVLIEKVYSRTQPQHLILNDSTYAMVCEAGQAKVYVYGRKMMDGKIGGKDLVRELSDVSGHFSAYWNQSGSFILCGTSIYRIFLNGRYRLTSEKLISDIQYPFITCIYYHQENRQVLLGTSMDGLYVINLPQFRSQYLPDTVASFPYYQQLSICNNEYIFASYVLFGLHKPTVLAHCTAQASGYIMGEKSGMYYEDGNDTVCYYNAIKNTYKPVKYIGAPVYGVVQQGDSALLISRRYLFSLSGGQIKKTDSLLLPDSLNINAIRHYHGDTVLILTTKGYYRYDLNKHKISKPVLPAKSITSFYRDDNGRLWITTYGPDIYMAEQDSVYNISNCFSTMLNVPHCFIPDDKGYFLIPTNSGLYKVCINDLVHYAHHKTQYVFYYKFGKPDGLPCEEFDGNYFGYPYTKQGDSLCISTLKGLVWVRPESLSQANSRNKIFIDEILLNEQPATYQAITDLRPDFQSLSFLVSTPYFGLPENRCMEYTIEGLDKAWKKLPESGLLTFNRLPAGAYQLRIRKHTGCGDEFVYLNIPFSVQPWFYQTWWFLQIVIATVGLLAYLLGKNRIGALKKRKEQLEHEVSARTSDLEETIDQLEKSERELAFSNYMRKKMMAMVIHDMRSPLSFLRKTANKLAKDYPGKNEPDKSIRLINTAVTSLHNFAENFFSWVLVNDEHFKVSKEHFDLAGLFRDIEMLYEALLGENHNTLLVNANNISCCTDYNILQAIIRNLVDNANKNCTNATITMSAAQHGGLLRITIADSGPGLTQGELDYFNGRKTDLGKNSTGSRIILDMLHKIGGRLEATSVLGEGSTFTILLPSDSTDDEN